MLDDLQVDGRARIRGRAKAEDLEADARLRLRPDLLTLASAILPERDEALAQFFKVPVNDDGFYIEALRELAFEEGPGSCAFVALTFALTWLLDLGSNQHRR